MTTGRESDSDSTVASSPETLDTAPLAPSGPADPYGALRQVDPADYVIKRELAKGGMGRILEAFDRRLGRTVAIKQLIAGRDDLRARFEREARITATLQHPSIVSIHEAGAWPSGEPFYAMKLVAGTSLGAAIAARPTLEERLALVSNVVAAVDALAYAHSRGVIHRDLKPQNVLVGEFGETVVIDWGIAKQLDAGDAPSPGDSQPGWVAAAADETDVGAVIGTPQYMAPEQARGEPVDARADVYALGAMLYHVLAGAPAYGGGTSKQILRAVKAGPAAPLAEKCPDAPPELVTIVEKAMARSPDDRYPNAKELADDLEKFQTGQLVGAHAYSTMQLVRRWIARHRTAVAVAAIAFAILFAGAVVSAVWIVRAEEKTREERAQAVKTRGEAEDLVGFMLFDLREKLRPIGRLDLLEVVARKAVAYYADRGDALGADDEHRHTAAISYLGDVLWSRGDATGALAQFRAALAIRERIAALAPGDSQRQLDLWSSHQDVANMLALQGDLAGALREYRGAAAIADAHAIDGEEWLRDDSTSHEKIGTMLRQQGATRDALAEYRRVIAVREQLTASKPANGDWLRELVVARIRLGDVLKDQGDLAGAQASFRNAADDGARLVSMNAANGSWANIFAAAHERIGQTLVAQGKLADAIAEFRRGLAIEETVVARDPSNALQVRDLLVYHRDIGEALQKSGDVTGALVELRAGLAVGEKLAAMDPSNADWQMDLADMHEDLGDALDASGDAAGALGEFRLDLAMRDKIAAHDPTNGRKQENLAVAHNYLGEHLLRAGDAAAAIAEDRLALRLVSELVKRDPDAADWQREVAVVHQDLGDARYAQKDVAGALGEYRAGLAIDAAIAARDAGDADVASSVANDHQRIGKALLASGDASGAIGELRAARDGYLALAAKDPDNDGWRREATHERMWLGDALVAHHELDAARAEYEAAQAIADARAAARPDDDDAQLDRFAAIEDVADARRAAGDRSGARALDAKARVLVEGALRAHPSSAAWDKASATLRSKGM